MKRWSLSVSALAGVVLALSLAPQTHADTRIAQQLGSDGTVVAAEHWGTRFVAATTTEVRSVALGVSIPCGSVQVGRVTASLFVPLGTFGSAVPIEGGYRFTSASVPLTEGATYYILHGSHRFPCVPFNLSVTRSADVPLNAQLFQVHVSNSWMPLGVNHFGISVRDIVYSVCAESDCTLAPLPPPCTRQCFSSVVFIPGIKGSVLKKGGDTLWPPTLWSNDIPQLALTAHGESVHDVRVDGILDTFTIGGPFKRDIYKPFGLFLDTLAAEGLMREWLPLAYDWRLSPQRVVAEGVKTPGGTLDVIAEIEQLAARSKSGKVAIVAHSMGGLVGKAIIKELEARGKADLVESFTLVGSPQLGTPQAIAALLHGDDEGILGGFLVRSGAARTLAQHLPGAYALLPSSAYFGKVAEPVIRFDTQAAFTAPWRSLWGDALSSYGPYEQFLTGAGAPRVKPLERELHKPEVLSAGLLADAAALHASLDAYRIPESIRTVQVAGWGRPTAKAVTYTSMHTDPVLGPLPAYTLEFTREGDKTVVYPSATAAEADETYYFNLFDYNKALGSDSQHSDLLNTLPVQEVLREIIIQKTVSGSDHLSAIKPVVEKSKDELIVSTHSPVILGAYDAAGNFTGVLPGQDPSGEVLALSEGIPGSTFLASAESQHLFLPKEGSYRIEYTGIGEGPTTVTIGTLSGDTHTPAAAYSDIPTAPGTRASFTLESAAPGEAIIAVDADGDGAPEEAVYPDGAAPSLAALLAQLREKVGELTAPEELKQTLLRRIANLEQRIEKKRERNAQTLAAFSRTIARHELKGRISAAGAAEIAALIGQLEALSETVAPDPAVLAELKEKITALSLKQGKKNDLLKRIDRLENTQALVKTLANLSAFVSAKAGKGRIGAQDAEALLRIISKIEEAV